MGDGERIGRVLPELGGLLRRPLVTLERVRVCKRNGELVAPPQQLPGTDERGRPLWQKLMVFTSERAMHDGQPVHQALVRRLRQTGSRGATALRGIWGFQGESAPHGDRVWQLGRRVPVVTVIVDVPDGVARSFGVVDEITAQHGVITSELVPALSLAHPGGQRARLRLARHRFCSARYRCPTRAGSSITRACPAAQTLAVGPNRGHPGVDQRVPARRAVAERVAGYWVVWCWWSRGWWRWCMRSSSSPLRVTPRRRSRRRHGWWSTGFGSGVGMVSADAQP